MFNITILLKAYLILSGALIHALLLAVVLLKPDFAYKVYDYGIAYLEANTPRLAALIKTPQKVYSLDREIAQNFESWAPLASTNENNKGIYIDKRLFSSLSQASKALRNGDTLHIGAGTYTEPLVINADNIRVIGHGHVIIERTSAEGKAAIIAKGNNTLIKNIECRHISVSDRNGACVRLAGSGLRLNHVYFHDSQQGLLTGDKPGLVEIDDSRFERLGLGGRAHGIYIGGGQLSLRNSLFIAAQNQGHEIKSRADRNIISNCIIASLSSDDSRLIDITGGGILTITDSILQQGPRSTNQDLIGYGLEKRLYAVNRAILTNNIIIMERDGPNVLFHGHKELPPIIASGNMLVSKNDPQLAGLNFIFKTRIEGGLGEYPSIPPRPNTKLPAIKNR
jgi:hypothetical protein